MSTGLLFFGLFALVIAINCLSVAQSFTSYRHMLGAALAIDAAIGLLSAALCSWFVIVFVQIGAPK